MVVRGMFLDISTESRNWILRLLMFLVVDAIGSCLVVNAYILNFRQLKQRDLDDVKAFFQF